VKFTTTNILNCLLKSGCNSNNDEDEIRQHIVIALFALVASLICITLGIRALIDQNWFLASSLVIATVLFAACRLSLLCVKGPLKYTIARSLLLFCLFSLMLYLLISGGKHNTGSLWIFVLPPMAMFIAGVSWGGAYVALFTVISCIFLFYPHDALLQASYSHDFKLRLVYAFVTVASLSAFYEYSRKKSYMTIKELSQKFAQLALSEPLTGLPNRRGIQQIIDVELARAQRNKTALSILLCDVDRFKKVNDNYGHDCGDHVLICIAGLFTKSIRKQDSVARWGGEEFLFVLPNTDAEQAYLLADKIRANLASETILCQQQQLHITASFGVCQVDLSASLDKSLSDADKAMYEAKEKGRNKVVIYNLPQN
jgi:diguanylate cyclase (GGDEF)-like protein